MLVHRWPAELPQVPSDMDVVTACEQQSKLTKTSYNCLVYPSHDHPIAFVKYGPEKRGMKEEMQNQTFAFEQLEKLQPQDRNGIRIPQIYRVIEMDEMIYIVMEYVTGTTLTDLRANDKLANEQEKCYDQIAKAITLFLTFDIPDQSPPGPVGGGIIKHPIFKDTVASLKYDSVNQLQEHLTRVANCPHNNNLRIDFTGEAIRFCFADLYEGNFIFTAAGSLYVVDFHHAAFLPTSFMTYALDQPRPVCAAIRNRFSLPQNKLEAMRVAGYYFMMSSRKVGLYLDGEKSKTRKERARVRHMFTQHPG